MTVVATERDEFVAAVQAFRRVSVEHPEGDPELLAEFPGGVVHSFLGGMGADWSADAVVELIAEAETVSWAGNLFPGHDLRVAVLRDGRRLVYTFDVRQPGLGAPSDREDYGIDWRGVVDRASAVAVGAGAPDDATLPEQVEWLAHELHGPTLRPAAEPDVVKDSESFLTDEARAFQGISARPLRSILKTLESLDGIVAGQELRAPLGDIDADVAGTLEVTVGEHDGTEVDPDSAKLVGWVVRVESWWEFVPCVPPRHWSTERAGWVSVAVIREENTRRREATP